MKNMTELARLKFLEIHLFTVFVILLQAKASHFRRNLMP